MGYQWKLGVRGTSLAFLAACIGLALAGCGAGEDKPASNSATTDLTTGVNVNRLKVAGKTKPEVHLPGGPPPKKIIVRDIEEGSGREAKRGDFIKLEYVGIKWNGRPYSDSWTYPEIPVFQLGSNRLEYGLDLGIRGMKPGGRREVIVPAHRLYEPGEHHGFLPPENAVVFVVDLLAIQ